MISGAWSRYLRPQSTSAIFSPASESRLQAQPPEAPDPTTITSNEFFVSLLKESPTLICLALEQQPRPAVRRENAQVYRAGRIAEPENSFAGVEKIPSEGLFPSDRE